MALANSGCPLLVDDPFDLRDRRPQPVLSLRLQRNRAAKLSGNAMIIREAVQVAPVTRRVVASAIASNVLQRFWGFLGRLVRRLDFRIIEARRV